MKYNNQINESVVRTSAAPVDNGIETRFIGPLFSKTVGDEKPTFLIKNVHVEITTNTRRLRRTSGLPARVRGLHLVYRPVRLYIVSRNRSVNETTTTIDCSRLDILHSRNYTFRASKRNLFRSLTASWRFHGDFVIPSRRSHTHFVPGYVGGYSRRCARNGVSSRSRKGVISLLNAVFRVKTRTKVFALMFVELGTVEIANAVIKTK